jgi:hypothetical protein
MTTPGGRMWYNRAGKSPKTTRLVRETAGRRNFRWRPGVLGLAPNRRISNKEPQRYEGKSLYD